MTGKTGKTDAPTMAEALKIMAAGQHGQVEQLLEDLDPADAEQLRAALLSDLSTARICKALALTGRHIGRNAVVGWRQRNAAR